MKKEIKKFRKEISSIKLTSEERSTLDDRIFAYISKNPVQSSKKIIYPYLFNNYTKAIILILFVGTFSLSISQLAAISIPGDALYPLKTNINEPLMKSLAFTDESKAKRYANIAENRLSEVNKVLDSSDEEVQKTKMQTIEYLNKEFKTNSDKLKEYTRKLQSTGHIKEANDIVDEFNYTLDDYKEIIEDESILDEIQNQEIIFEELDEIGRNSNVPTENNESLIEVEE